MKREISSAATPFYKAVFLFGFGLVGTSLIFSKINDFKYSNEILAFQIITTILQIAAIALFGYLVIPLVLSWKRVEIDDLGLIITEANFFVTKTSTFVPFDNIKFAHQTYFLRGNPGTVTVEFYEPTFFGKKIRFVAKYRWTNYSAHPIVDEINNLVSKDNSFLRP